MQRDAGGDRRPERLAGQQLEHQMRHHQRQPDLAASRHRISLDPADRPVGVEGMELAARIGELRSTAFRPAAIIEGGRAQFAGAGEDIVGLVEDRAGIALGRLSHRPHIGEIGAQVAAIAGGQGLGRAGAVAGADPGIGQRDVAQARGAPAEVRHAQFLVVDTRHALDDAAGSTEDRGPRDAGGKRALVEHVDHAGTRSKAATRLAR